ncbi:nicotinamide N-methyltransferase-like [Oscarella lobularis]|uniref:nicotinamide N-methyltransferase-like n=1 Tax=Oscarella lobularis TaxID=121494 RepID=UPI0033141884
MDGFDPEQYCRLYCTFDEGCDPEETDRLRENLRVLDGYYERIGSDLAPASSRLLEYGGGPTVWPLISAARHVNSITFVDYLDANLEFVKKWQKNVESAFDCSSVFRYVVNTIEKNPSADEVDRRQERVRSSIRDIISGDLRLDAPADPRVAAPHSYDVVSCHYTVGHACHVTSDYIPFVKKLGNYLKPGKFLLLSDMPTKYDFPWGNDSGDGKDVNVKDKEFIIDAVRRAGFEVLDVQVVTRPTPDEMPAEQVMVLARKQ